MPRGAKDMNQETIKVGEVAAVKKVMVATDRSETADRAVRWAADLAASYDANLLLLQILLPTDGDAVEGTDGRVAPASNDLLRFAQELAGRNGLARVVVHQDPAQAILDAIEEESVDAIVVGNVGMSGRKEFLLGNIPNRISHNARCTVIIVNTARADGQVHSSARWEEPSTLEGPLLSRAWRIGRVMVKAGVRDMLSRRTAGDSAGSRATAQRFRAALEELGPTFAKLGQILSTRPDLIPPEFVEELSTLQERVTPLTEAEVVVVMEQELGVPWEDVFGSIEPTPLAAGTIAQVHRATLESGERVVVKVQRPTAEQDIVQDLSLLEMFAQKAALRPALQRVIDIPTMVEHLSSSLRRELDFRREAANIRRMSDVLTPFSRLGVPAVYDDYSTSRLLVMQEIQGVPVREAPPGPARKEAARQLLESYYHQVMSEGFFHADPHPGNMKWWNDTIYLLDLGMVGEVDARVRQLILMLLLAFSQRDAGFLGEIVVALASGDEPSEPLDLPSFREDLQQLIARYRDISLKDLQMGPMMQEITEVSLRHNVRLPASLALTGKAFAQMQLVAAELDPELDPFVVAESFMMRSAIRQLTHGIEPAKLFYEAQKTRVRVGRLLEALEGVVGARPGSNLQIDFRGTEHLEQTVSHASRQLALALSLTGALVVTAATVNSPRVPRWIPGVMGSMGTALAARLLVSRPHRRR
jgi:ubiquinone biosynthesis protein